MGVNVDLSSKCQVILDFLFRTVEMYLQCAFCMIIIYECTEYELCTFLLYLFSLIIS